MLRQTLAFVAAASMAAAPVMAQAQPSAAPLSVADRAGAETANGNDLRGGNWFPPVLFALIVLGGILLATGVIFDDDDPDSP
jgi:hypothetical protein